MPKSLLTVIFITIIINVSGRAETINIPANYSSIQAAIDSSAAGDTLLVRPGVYHENIDFRGKNIVLGSLYLTTGDKAYIDSTVIDGDSSGTVITFNNHEDSTCKCVGFTIQNGYAYQNGGGIQCSDANPVIENNIIKNNLAKANGGGISCESYSKAEISNNVIVGNVAGGNGGGVHCHNSEPNLNGNTINNNYAGRGGGIYCIYSFPQIKNNVVTENSARLGGGISSIGSKPSFSDNTFKNNNSGVMAPER